MKSEFILGIIIVLALIIAGCGSDGIGGINQHDGDFWQQADSLDVYISFMDKEVLVLVNLDDELEDYEGQFIPTLKIDGIDYSSFIDFALGTIYLYELPFQLVPGHNYEVEFDVTLQEYSKSIFSKKVNGTLEAAQLMHWDNPVSTISPDDEIRFDWSLNRSNMAQCGVVRYSTDNNDHFQRFELETSTRSFTFPKNYLDEIMSSNSWNLYYQIFSLNYYMDDDCVIISQDLIYVENGYSLYERIPHRIQQLKDIVSILRDKEHIAD